MTLPPNGLTDAFYSRFTDQYHMEHTTYIGGEEGDAALGVAEWNGAVVVTGQTESPEGIEFTGPPNGFVDDDWGSGNSGAAQGTCWLARFEPDGDRDWMTLFGPKFALQPANVDVDDNGNIYVGGTVHWYLPIWGQPPVEFTDQPTGNSMPICGSGFSQSTMGFADEEGLPAFWSDGFLAKFTVGLELERSTFFSGSSYIDEITDMEVDRESGSAFFVGRTFSPLGTNADCEGTAAPEDPGFPWCPGSWSDPYYVPGMPPDVLHMGMESGFLGIVKNTGELLYCSSIGTPDEISGVAAVTVSNGRITLVGNTANEDYVTGCEEPPIGYFPQCNPQGGNSFTFPFYPNSNEEYWFIMQFDATTLELIWSSSLGNVEPKDVSADDLGNVYVTGEPRTLTWSQTPLMDHPDYYSSSLPGTGESTVVLGFNSSGQFWGTFHGNHAERFAVASRVNERIYIAGTRGDEGFVPYNCPWGVVDPWCVDNAAVSGLCYSQLHATLPVGLDERPTRPNGALTCFPNPARTTLTLVVCSSFDGPGSLTVTDQTGRETVRQRVNLASSMVTLDLKHFAPGSYTARIVQEVGPLSGTGSFIVLP